ncbi:unnamed protein product [Mytilus edulis]|uniref:Uncharacterized protein n=1 Tax=Mytilus edulis TaxID=6550 RepID=A0A8S3RPJ0_MYTED|nr:unnamed protein product [Mytilus edulis]
MIDANEQLNVQAEFKRGTLVMKFSPAAFLMFHKHTLAFYEKSSRLTAISHFKRDTNNLIVEESLSIKPITNDKVGRRQAYRINLYKTAFFVEANGREIKDLIKNDLHEILSTLPSLEFLNNMNTAIQDSCKSFLSDQDSNNWIQSDKISSHSAIVPTSSRDKNDPLLTNLNRTQNSASIETITDNNSIKQPKQTGPKKQTILKQDDLKSKLAVAEAHIAALENTILNNNNLIRNMKLTQLGQNDYHQNGPDHHSYRQTPSSISANCSNCHCSQVINRIRDLEREMSNLRP